jgi:putative oxidoreductase
MIAQQRLLALGSLALQPNQSTNTAFQISWTILRIVAGVVMVHNGLDKLANIESFATPMLPISVCPSLSP